MKVIALSGVSGCGKNYIADVIKDNFENVELMAFADPLKKMASIMSALPIEDMYTSEGKKKSTWIPRNKLKGREKETGFLTVRELQQTLGTEVIRESFWKDFWVYFLYNRILSSKANIVVITDCRFENEANGLLSLNGLEAIVGSRIQSYIVRVVGRSANIGNTHVSEKLDWDANWIFNNSEGTTKEYIINYFADNFLMVKRLDWYKEDFYKLPAPPIDCHLGKHVMFPQEDNKHIQFPIGDNNE